MQIIELIEHPDLVDAVGNRPQPLTVAHWDHLFRWKGELLFGCDRPTDPPNQPDAIAPKKKWDYSAWDSSSAPYLDRESSPASLPPNSIEWLKTAREEIHLAIATAPPPPRANRTALAQRFEQAQIEARRDRTQNRLIAELSLESLAPMEKYDRPLPVPPKAQIEGAVWVLDAIARDTIEGLRISRELVQLLGIGQSAIALRDYLGRQPAIVPPEQRIEVWRSQIADPMRRKVWVKLAEVRKQMCRWRDRTITPVMAASGDAIDEELTGINAAVCLVAIARLEQLGGMFQGFAAGIDSAMLEMEKV